MHRILWSALALVAVLALGACAALQYPSFGKLPAGSRQAAMEASPNYRDGAFQNAVPTPTSTDGTPFLVAMVRGRFEPRPSPPGAPIPTVKTDLQALPANEDVVVWLGHSSYYVQLAGRRILIDPVLSDHAAPFPVGYALEAQDKRLFFSGDSGFGPHFAEIARRFGSFDLAVLDAGQYNPRWAYIHMNPEEAARAAQLLGARALMPAHVGRFTLARHAWDEPFDRSVAAAAGKPYRLLTPRIGEPVRLDDENQRFPRWWKDVSGTTAH